MKYGVNTIIVGLFLVIGVTLAGVKYLGAFPTIPKPSTNSTERLSWFLQLDHPYIHKGSNGEILMNINIKGNEAPLVDRAPLNLVLVIDRSGSMSEKGKIEYAKEAAKQIISGLSPKDRLSVVAYSTDVELLYPIQFLNNKEGAASVVNSLYPTDSTNLSGGLIAGIGQLEKLERKGYINRVILLSDGLANYGITDMGQLIKIASQAAERGIHVTTMGLGVNYDENLMMNLAEYGAGNYYFVESPSQLAGIFDREFGQLASTVAKDPVFTITLAPGVGVSDVYGYAYETTKDGKVRIKLGDFYGGQERNILVKLNAPTGKMGESPLATAGLEYGDVLGDDGAIYHEEKIRYAVTEDMDIVAEKENKDVTARGVSVDAAAQYYQAASAYETGEHDEALMHIQSAYDSVVELNKKLPSPATLKQESEMRDALSTMMLESAPAPASPEGKGLIKGFKQDARQQQK